VAGIKVENWADSYSSLVEPAVLEPFLALEAQIAYLKDSISSPATLFLVAEAESGELVGFALAYLDREPEPWLESLHVAAAFRGRGAGTQLMRDLAARLRQRGHRSLRLGVVKGNDGAGKLYERLGATNIGEEPTGWAAGVDHVIYRWPDLAALTRAPYNPADDKRW
jgi:ribosomal protein S18 acetylase RimI-like enzyme